MPKSAPELEDVTTRRDTNSISSLLKRLGAEGGELLRAEMALAKLEFRELARQAALDGAKVGAAVALAMVGGLALGAAGVLALGDVLGDHYALAALLVGLVLLVAGLLLARWGLRGMAGAPRVPDTAASLRENREWAAAELSDLRAQLKRGSTDAPQLPKNS